MDFLALRDRVRDLCAAEGYADMSPPPDFAAAVNQALYMFSWEAEYNEREITFSTVAGVALYTLENPPDVKLVKDVYYHSTLGAGSTALVRSSEAYERSLDPMWRMKPNGTPYAYWVPEPNTLRLYPPPDASSIPCLAICICAEGPLTQDTDTPLCPAHYHEDIARLAAWHIAQAYATGEARERAFGYRAEALNHAGDIRAEHAQQSYFNLTRKVRSVPRRRIWL